MRFKNASRKEMIRFGGREVAGLRHLGFERLSVPWEILTLGARHMIGSRWFLLQSGRKTTVEAEMDGQREEPGLMGILGQCCLRKEDGVS